MGAKATQIMIVLGISEIEKNGEGGTVSSMERLCFCRE